MFKVEFMQDSAKGANTQEIFRVRSNDVTRLLDFINDNAIKIFENSDDFIENYYYEAISDCLKDCKNLSKDNKTDLNRLKKYYEVAYSLEGEFEDDTANDLFNIANNDLVDLAHNKKICKFILEELNMFNIGINFSETEEEE